MTDNQRTLLAGLIGAGAGTVHGLYGERTGTGNRLQTLLRALGYSGLAMAGTHGVSTALKNEGLDLSKMGSADMGKEAAVPLLAAAIPWLTKALGAYWLAQGAYGAGKNVYRAGKDVYRGDYASGAKNLGRAGMEAAFALPVVGAAGRSLRGAGMLMRTGNKALGGTLSPGFRRLGSGLAGASANSPRLQAVGDRMIRAGSGIENNKLVKYFDAPKFLSRRGAAVYGAPALLPMVLGEDPRYSQQGLQPRRTQPSSTFPQFRLGTGEGKTPYTGGPNTYFSPGPAAAGSAGQTFSAGGYAGFPRMNYRGYF